MWCDNLMVKRCDNSFIQILHQMLLKPDWRMEIRDIAFFPTEPHSLQPSEDTTEKKHKYRNLS